MVNTKIVELIDSFISDIKDIENLSEITVSSYKEALLKIFSILEIEILKSKSYKIKHISYLNIKQLLSYFTNEGNSPSTRSWKISCLKSFFKFLKYDDHLKNNIMDKIKHPKLPKRIVLIPKEQAKIQFFDHLENKHYYINELHKLTFLLFYYLKYSTFARTIEMTRLRVRDIDFDFKEILLRGKGNKERGIPSPPLTNKALELAKEMIIVLKLRKDDFLIRDINGDRNESEPYFKRALMKRHKALLRKSGLKSWMTLHRLFRKTPANVFYNKMKKYGIGIIEMMKLLGHSDPKTTMIYVEGDISNIIQNPLIPNPLE